MRITGGKAKGIRIIAPKGYKIRPATDKNREAVFASLNISIEGSTCIDLFAGSGSYGLEALSRKAKSCTFIDKEKASIESIKINFSNVQKSAKINSENAVFKKLNLLSLPKSPNLEFDVIFLDPPYLLWEKYMKFLLDELAIFYSHKNTILVIEIPGNVYPISKKWSSYKSIGKNEKSNPKLEILKKVN